jgi:acetamidase/formamidase
VRRFSSASTTLFFDPRAEPLGVLEPGERVVVETADSLCGIAKAEAPRGYAIDDVLDRLGGACPLTGPFAVRGARAGQVLAVHVHDVRARPPVGTAWTGVFRGFGALTREGYTLQEPLEPVTTLLPYEDGVAHLPAGGRRIAIPLHPFLGTIGVAPRWERRMSFSQSTEYLGDVDLPQITAGATLVLPVNVDGALLALGDAHGAQGDGEITGAAVEIEAEAELSVRVHDAEEAGFVALPQLNTDDRLGSIAALQGVPLGECARAAYVDLVHRLEHHHGLPLRDAYQLLGQVGRLHVGNMIDPFYSVLATIDRRYLEG